MKTLFLSLLASALVLPTAFSQTLLHVNFSDSTPGQAPVGATLSGLSQGRIIVVSSDTDPVDPFGPDGNKSMLIEKSIAGSPPTAGWKFDSTASGDISFTVYGAAQGSFGNPMGIVYLYEGNSIGAAVSLAANGSISILGRLTDSGNNASIVLSSSYTKGAPTTFKVAFTENTFSVYMDDALLQTAGGQSTFYFRSGVEAFDGIRFAQASTTDINARLYVNEFTVTSAIPEPSTAAMLGLMGVAAGAMGRFKFCKK